MTQALEFAIWCDMEKNAVERAVWAVGGPTKATFVCRISLPTLWAWRKSGVIPNGRAAVLLAQAAQAAGEDVTVDQLVGLETVSGNGDGGDKPTGFRKGGRVITATYPGVSPDLPVAPRFPDTAARAA